MDKMMVRYGDVWFADLGIPGGTDPERYMWKLKATVETVLKTLA